MTSNRHCAAVARRYDPPVPAVARSLRSPGWLAPALLSLITACVGSGELPARISGQIVGADEQGLGPGLILIEAGPVHDGAYILGRAIDESGRFTVDLPGGGTYGLHLFVDDYQYLPAEIEIADHQQIVLTSPMIAWGVWMDLTGEHSWPTQPDDATLTRMPEDEIVEDNPVLEGVQMAWEGDVLQITAEVSDPDDDLSRMVLVHDEATGAGYGLNAPAPADDRGNYPQGTWSLTLFADDLHVPGESRLCFVVSDNLCNDTPITCLPLPER